MDFHNSGGTFSFFSWMNVVSVPFFLFEPLVYVEYSVHHTLKLFLYC